MTFTKPVLWLCFYILNSLHYLLWSKLSLNFRFHSIAVALIKSERCWVLFWDPSFSSYLLTTYYKWSRLVMCQVIMLSSPLCWWCSNLCQLINNYLDWKDQENLVIQKLYLTLRGLWSSVDLIPVFVRMKLNRNLGRSIILNSDLIFSKSAIDLTNRHCIAMNSCVWFIFNILCGDSISQHSAKILGMLLNWFYSYISAAKGSK
jgi:hypothetical protein